MWRMGAVMMMMVMLMAVMMRWSFWRKQLVTWSAIGGGGVVLPPSNISAALSMCICMN